MFFESTQNPKVIAQITKETGATVGGELYADGLGKPDGRRGHLPRHDAPQRQHHRGRPEIKRRLLHLACNHSSVH